MTAVQIIIFFHDKHHITSFFEGYRLVEHICMYCSGEDIMFNIEMPHIETIGYAMLI